MLCLLLHAETQEDDCRDMRQSIVDTLDGALRLGKTLPEFRTLVAEAPEFMYLLQSI